MCVCILYVCYLFVYMHMLYPFLSYSYYIIILYLLLIFVSHPLLLISIYFLFSSFIIFLSTYNMNNILYIPVRFASRRAGLILKRLFAKILKQHSSSFLLRSRGGVKEILKEALRPFFSLYFLQFPETNAKERENR